MSSLATVTYNGGSYYEFNLDVGQSGNNPISLIGFKIFVTHGSPFTSTANVAGLLTSATPMFNLNGAGAVRVDAQGGTGNGSGDMAIYVPANDIGNTGNLYLYAQFGLDGSGAGYAPDGSFEEWSAVEGPQDPIVPDGGTTALLLGLGVSALGLFRRKLS